MSDEPTELDEATLDHLEEALSAALNTTMTATPRLGRPLAAFVSQISYM